MKDDIGSVIFNMYLECLTKHLSNPELKSSARKLGNRVLEEINIPPDMRLSIINCLYDLLSNYQQRELLGGDRSVSTEVSRSGKAIKISVGSSAPVMYRLGLALSDGSILSRDKIIFSTTKPQSLTSILHGFGEVLLYPARIVKYRNTERIAYAINVIIQDHEVANLMQEMRMHAMIGNINFIKEFINSLSKSEISQLLAGVIDGDGTIDKDCVRISVNEHDVIYFILKNVFKELRYDSKRFLIRISTFELRTLEIINEVTKHLLIPYKRERMEHLVRKRFRFDLKLKLNIDVNTYRDIIAELDVHEKDILSRFKFRNKGRYVYAFIHTSKENEKHIQNKLKKLLSKVSTKLHLETDLALSVKRGKREIIIYNQGVVALIKKLKEILEDLSSRDCKGQER